MKYPQNRKNKKRPFFKKRRKTYKITKPFPKHSPDALRRLRMKEKLASKHLRQRLFRQIVAGWAKAPGGDQDVRPLPGDFDGGLQPLRIISHHCMIIDVDPQR
mgnify:CR=1 FL=1